MPGVSAPRSSAQQATVLPDPAKLLSSEGPSINQHVGQKRTHGAMIASSAKQRSATLSKPTGPSKSTLLPPQLQGRSNVSTEDLERLGMAKNKSKGQS
ncbi:hypothetical protein WJX74_002232 [Apatococcus lobatus]|uniref:Uncharacterized protein n=2 Tax=Apatococcus TaxID=904362 RepID=A0AAW1SLU7_9CHLO